MAADQQYTEADIQLVAEWLRKFQGWPAIRKLDREYARDILGALAAAGRLLPEGASRQVWILGTDYADDEIFGVAATREEVEAIKRRVSDRTDLSLNPVLYSLPYPSPPTGVHVCAEKCGALVIGDGDIERCGCGQDHGSTDE